MKTTKQLIEETEKDIRLFSKEHLICPKCNIHIAELYTNKLEGIKLGAKAKEEEINNNPLQAEITIMSVE